MSQEYSQCRSCHSKEYKLNTGNASASIVHSSLDSKVNKVSFLRRFLNCQLNPKECAQWKLHNPVCMISNRGNQDNPADVVNVWMTIHERNWKLNLSLLKFWRCKPHLNDLNNLYSPISFTSSLRGFFCSSDFAKTFSLNPLHILQQKKQNNEAVQHYSQLYQSGWLGDLSHPQRQTFHSYLVTTRGKKSNIQQFL